MAKEDPRPTPKKLADFEVIRRLGTGGMAEVFLAKKRGAEGTFKLLVVKRILPAHGSSQKFRSMFAEEAQLATRLNHPNIVQVYDFQDYGDEGQLLSMEYVEGPDLRRLHRTAKSKGERLSPFVAAYVIAEVAKGLHYAHERKDEGGAPLDIVHRDISPQNILLSFDGTVKVADFGIATANMFRQEPGVLKGKTSYMSPEQARAEKVDRRSDIYSLGVVFHELLTGRPLHGAAEGKELLEAVRSGNVEPPSMFARGVPSELEEIVMQALALERENRFSSAREMASAITRELFQQEEPVDSHTLESVISEFVNREHTSPGEEPPRTGSRDLESIGLELKAASSPGDSDSHTIDSEILIRQRRLRSRAGREVRHVALVGLHIHGRSEMERAIGKAQAARLAEQLRSIFDEIAYKRGARWSWDADEHETGERPFEIAQGRAVVGLMANPSRAAADAAWLAIDVHEALQGVCDGLPKQLSASVSIVRGIAEGRRDKAGHLTQYKLQAPAGSLAGLLGERTNPRQTWVAGGIYRVVRRDFVWNDLPSLELTDLGEHDLPRTMRIYELLRPLTRDEKRLQLSLAPRDLVGRDAELADLHASYHQSVTSLAGEPQGQLTARLVIGEMGIGKSALLATFLSELPPDARELRVECSPHRSELPFSNAGQWLRELTGIRPDEPVEQARGAIEEMLGELPDDRQADEIIRRMSELATGRVAPAADEAEAALNRRLLNSGLRHFFARAAQQSPLVVSVDGLHWIDIASLELLVSLVRRADPLPILVLLITRPDDRVMSYVEGIVRVELTALSSENQVRLVEAHIGASAGVEEACADLIPRAAGNPFFLLEMVDALLERGKLDLKEDESGQVTLVRVTQPGDADQSLPSTLEQLIADRLNELPPEERAVVDWLAVSRSPLAHMDLTSLLEVDADDAIARLCARGLCDIKVESVDVRHPLTRDVAYLALDRRERADMHQHLGELLARGAAAHGLGAAMVARHFSRGHQPERAADYYLEAASVARSGFQLKLAASYYESALEVLPQFDERCLEPYSVLEDICRVQGRWKERKRHLEALRECAKRSQKGTWIAAALIRHAQFDFDAGHLTHGLSLAQLGEEVAEQAQSATLQVQAQSLMAEMLRDLGEMQGALAACDRALETVNHANVPPRLRAEVLRAQATLLLRVGRVQEAVSAHAEAIAVFRQTLARRQEARAKSSLSFAMYVLGKFEDAIALALEAIRIDLSIGGRFQIAKTLSNIGQSYARLGDLRRAAGYLERARDAHEKHEDQDSIGDTLLCCAELHVELCEYEAALEYVTESEAISDFSDTSYDAVHARLVRALIARRMGNCGAAVMYAFDARQIAESQAYVAFHFYAMALEAATRVDIGEQHTAILLATTTMGAIETLQGSEYGLETRALCVETLTRTGSPQAPETQIRAAAYARKLLDSIRNPELKRSFASRPVVMELLKNEPASPSAPMQEPG
jgi:serine/threonine protein kinase/tetratricopeptide (TPR) repeat protein